MSIVPTNINNYLRQFAYQRRVLVLLVDARPKSHWEKRAAISPSSPKVLERRLGARQIE